MDNIDLQYIGANECQSFLSLELYDFVAYKLENEISRIKGYIEKYDNVYDRNRVNISELKLALVKIETKLEKLRELE